MSGTAKLSFYDEIRLLQARVHYLEDVIFAKCEKPDRTFFVPIEIEVACRNHTAEGRCSRLITVRAYTAQLMGIALKKAKCKPCQQADEIPF